MNDTPYQQLVNFAQEELKRLQDGGTLYRQKTARLVNEGLCHLSDMETF